MLEAEPGAGAAICELGFPSGTAALTCEARRIVARVERVIGGTHALHKAFESPSPAGEIGLGSDVERGSGVARGVGIHVRMRERSCGLGSTGFGRLSESSPPGAALSIHDALHVRTTTLWGKNT